MAPVTTKPPKSPAQVPHVLVVEDEPALVELIGEMVGGQISCRISSARTLGEARQILIRESTQLLLIDINLPDGNGTQLIPTLRKHSPSAQTIVITGAPCVDHAISALREGAIDFLLKPFSSDHLVERVKCALKRQTVSARSEQRLDKLRLAVRRLNEARKTVTKKVDLLCNDLVNAYGELSRQMDSVRTHDDFRKTIEQAKDLEQLLCHAMDWILRDLGYANCAVWLAADDQQYQLAAYIKYTIAGERDFTDAMKHGLLKQIIREGHLHLTATQIPAKLSAPEAKVLAGNEVLATTATYLGETLAAVVLFRDQASPFTEDDRETLQAVAPIFALALATIVKATSDPEDASPFEEQNDSGPGKGDSSDWWKRGEAPPF